MTDQNETAAPFNPLPPVVVVLAILIGVMELIFQLGEFGIIGGFSGIGWRSTLIERFGFFNSILFWMWDVQQFPPKHLLRFVSYIFIHANFVGALFSMVFTLTLGKFIVERSNSIVFLSVFFGTSILTAPIHAMIIRDYNLMIGTGAAAYGLIGALSWIQFTRLRAAGETGYRAFSMIFALAIIHLIFFLIDGGNDWIERLIGFCLGFCICLILRPAEGLGIGLWIDRLRVR